MSKQKPNEQVQQIPLSEIRPFKNHPFKVTDDELMQQTIDKRRVKKYLGRMTRQQMDEIGEAIEEALGLYVPEEMEAP